jgi:hypothetical protein
MRGQLARRTFTRENILHATYTTTYVAPGWGNSLHRKGIIRGDSGTGSTSVSAWFCRSFYLHVLGRPCAKKRRQKKISDILLLQFPPCNFDLVPSTSSDIDRYHFNNFMAWPSEPVECSLHLKHTSCKLDGLGTKE